MDRATAWRDTWSTTRHRGVELPHARGVFSVLLGLLAVVESLAEFVVGHGSIPRMFAESATTGVRDGGVAGVQLAMVVGLLCLFTALPLALLRPLPAGVTVTAASFGSLVIFQTLTLAGFAAQCVAQYRLGRSGHPVAAVLLGAPFLALALPASQDTDFRTRVVLLAALAPVAALVGLVRRTGEHQREHTAVQQVMAGTQWENAARGERARTVRELHDVVGHHISMIAVRAETARVATPGMPAVGADRLLGIGDTARAALTEMRRLLGVLREDTEPVTGGERRPQPDLRRLGELLDEAREASGSTSVRLILSGSPRTLEPGLELAAYRIVQESLTNARKHAPGAAVDVELIYTEDALRMRIRDNGPGPPHTERADGHGLLGMRERAAAVGGQIRTGSTAVGGFVVDARFPAVRERVAGGGRGRRWCAAVCGVR
ncbi:MULTISPECIES: sensor histidine kinase [Streptomyces]|uniref:histidine kinase n=1 Tax=Streptomyces avermitilis (strain ATCC 31267 / DSM 46492 / JCM 5070 / NBRC 14893 / NCIMB 12804 / NRRL 8165 / MA-4680) TaxID=227882 RepID=Q82LF1_STRAW|nr:histidine kinase [Streptomyces avermitilis]BAC69770.1 putative two-component system sensor kinase [Streptomyces avermitilis MA-4680 = NBRC 14893]